MDAAQIILVCVALVAGLIRGFAGFGGPMVMLPVLSLFLAPAQAMWVMMWVDLLANVRLLPQALPVASRQVLAPLTAGTAATMPVGVLLLAAGDPELMRRVIGGTVVAASLLLLSGWRYPWRQGMRSLAAAGMLGGLVMGATSIAVTVALFLSAGGRSAGQTRADFIVWVFLATVLLLTLLALLGAVVAGDALQIAILAPAYLIGTGIGSRLHGRAPEALVRRVVLLLAAAIGALAALR